MGKEKAGGSVAPERQGLEQLARLFANIKPRSQYSVKCAIETANTDGLGGTLIVQIGTATSKPVEVVFTNGPSQLVTDVWKLAT